MITSHLPRRRAWSGAWAAMPDPESKTGDGTDLDADQIIVMLSGSRSANRIC